MSAFKFYELEGPISQAPVAKDVNTSDWTTIQPYDYWAQAKTNFVLRTEVQTPADWSSDQEVALYFPLGEPGTFSHPEALIYIDGVPFAATDRHHQEVLLPAEYIDGKVHQLALHGWSGNVHREGDNARLFMRPCEIVQIDRPTRDFFALARTALGIARHNW